MNWWNDWSRLWEQGEYQVPVQVLNAWRFQRHSSRTSRWSLADEMIEHTVHRTNMCRARELKDSIKTTPRRDWRLPGNPPLYGCLTSPPRRDHSHHKSRFDGIADAVPRRRSQLLCLAIHFNGNQISSATKYLAQPYISPRRFMSRALLTASTNKRSAHRVRVAQRVPSAGEPSQTSAKKLKTQRQGLAHSPPRSNYKGRRCRK